jgi:UDP-glucose 4-epimerase
MVTGGAGYIGSVVTEELLNAGHDVIVLDDLSKGHAGAVPSGATLIRQDLGNQPTVTAILKSNRIESVIHLAAASLVGESIVDPHRYYRINVGSSLALLDAMREANIRRIVFSSSAAVYGEPEKQPIEEEDRTVPSNPYGETKLAIERALHWYANAHALNYVALRYFNAAGATEHCGEVHEPESHLIPLVLQVAAGRRGFIPIFGDDYPTRDGTCIRDYVHVRDVAKAHLLALGVLDYRSATYNIGCGGEGYSVKEVIQCAADITGKAIPIRRYPRRPGDPAVLIATATRISEELGWIPRQQRLEEMIGTAWRWMQTHTNGYSEEGLIRDSNTVS